MQTKLLALLPVFITCFYATSQTAQVHHFNKSSFNDFNGTAISKKVFDSYLDSSMKVKSIPGLTIAIINKGKIVYYQTRGYANLEQKLPVTEQTIFEGASISKSVFAFFVMRYVEEGKLDLDKPLYEYLPYEDIAYDERYKKITARMVLSNRTGFPNWRDNDKDMKLTIKFEPGTNYLYSGEGFQYLTLVLKSMEGNDWNALEAAFQRKVAKPLGMAHTVFIPDSVTLKNKAGAYNNGKWFDPSKAAPRKKHKGPFMGASTIHTEPLDFSKWMIAVMNKKFLSKKSYAELLKPHSTISGNDPLHYYTLGFFNLAKPYQNIYYHDGNNNDRFTCYYLLDPEKDWGYVVFTNCEWGQELGDKIREYLVEGKK
jgi:CubicO group peptidase (beta-lactamase class C family)